MPIIMICSTTVITTCRRRDNHLIQLGRFQGAQPTRGRFGLLSRATPTWLYKKIKITPNLLL